MKVNLKELLFRTIMINQRKIMNWKMFGKYWIAEQKIRLLLYDSFEEHQKPLKAVEFAQNLFRDSTTRQTFVFDAVANFFIFRFKDVRESESFWKLLNHRFNVFALDGQATYGSLLTFYPNNSPKASWWWLNMAIACRHEHILSD